MREHSFYQVTRRIFLWATQTKLHAGASENTNLNIYVMATKDGEIIAQAWQKEFLDRERQAVYLLDTPLGHTELFL